MAAPSTATDVRNENAHAPESLRGPVVVVAPPSTRVEKLALALVGVAFVVVCGLLGYLLHRLHEQERREALQLQRLERRLQRVDAGISFEAKRRQLLLGMRDEIVRVNPRIGLHDAYRYAEFVLQASEKYPTVPPLLLIAVGVVESGFRTDAVSAAEARGLYQIWPSTGRLLARSLGWEFSDELLFDPQKNTEMAALYLDILYAAYNDPSLVLAEYNGGPRNAGLFRAGHNDVAEETRNYVPKVLAVYDRLRGELGAGVAADSMYRDRERWGKRLVAQRATTASDDDSTPPHRNAAE